MSDALVQYRRVKEIRTQQDLLVTTLQDRSRLAYMRYQGGVDTLLNALDADRDLFDAELSLAQTRRNELAGAGPAVQGAGRGLAAMKGCPCSSLASSKALMVYPPSCLQS